MLAVITAIETKHAFSDFDISARLAAPLTGLFTNPAVDTFVFYLANAPNREPANNSQKRARRTNESAVKSRYNKIQQNRCGKYCQYQPAKLIVTGVEVKPAPLSKIGSRTS